MTAALPQFLSRKQRRAMERQGREWVSTPAPATLPALKERPSIAICMPFEEQVYAKFVTEALIPVISGMSSKDYICTVSGSFIDTARRVLVEQALSTDAEYLWFIDTDNIPFGGMDVAERLLSHGKDIVGAWYRTKQSPHNPCVYDYDSYDAVKDWHNYRPRLNAPEDPDAPKCHCGKHHAQYIEKVDGLGFGSILINRRVFETITEQWFSTKQGTEDLHALRLAKKYGYDCYVDWGTHAAHLGVAAY